MQRRNIDMTQRQRDYLWYRGERGRTRKKGGKEGGKGESACFVDGKRGVTAKTKGR